MTPRYPGARWQPVGTDLGGNNGPRAFAWHTAITTSEDISGWVAESNACHMYIGQRGNCQQFKDFDRIAYGVIDGNQRGVVTVESWDGLPVRTATWDDVNEGSWTPQMCERIADIMAFCDVSLGIPLQRMHSTRDMGHGGHCTGIRGRSSHRGIDMYEGPDKWSGPGKPCPGDLRILQLYGPLLDGGVGSIMARGRQIAGAIRAGQCDLLPTGDVDLPAALARTSTDWFDSATVLDVARAVL